MPTGARDIVPVLVIGPPTRPVPVETEDTVPMTEGAGAVLVMVRLLPLPETLMPDPAVRVRMPVLAIVTVPIPETTEMPTPGRMVGAPEPPPLISRVPVMLLIEKPLPTISGPVGPYRYADSGE